MNLKLPTFILALVFSQIAVAEVSLVESQKVTIEVGAKDFSMIDVFNRKVMHVDVDYNKCDLSSERSQKVGKIIFKPKSDKPFTMFLTDNHQDTYTIKIVVKKDKEPDLFTIKNEAAELAKKKANSAVTKYEKSTVKAIDLSSGHVKAIHDLTLAMALNDLPKNTDVNHVNRYVQFWKEAEILEKTSYSIGKLKGVKYVLKNISQSKMVLAESEFYKLNESTLSIAIEKPVLEAGESTQIFVVKANQ